MLQAHFDAIEQRILATSRVPANSGHTIHRGTPRESFIREFLQSHLSERVAIGTGEIIDSKSQAREPRNQFDIVIYRRDYPKLDFGGDIHAFLSESVLATIEVKSILDRAGIMQSVRAARKAKSLQRNIITAMHTGYQPPAILNYVVAYDGPSAMSTVRDWVHSCQVEEGIAEPSLTDMRFERVGVPSPSLDAVFVLGKGFWYFDNVPASLLNDSVLKDNPIARWVYANSPTNNILLLFVFLTLATSGATASWLDPLPYLTRVDFGQFDWGGLPTVAT